MTMFSRLHALTQRAAHHQESKPEAAYAHNFILRSVQRVLRPLEPQFHSGDTAHNKFYLDLA